MMWDKVADGNLSTLRNLSVYENALPEGQRARLDLTLKVPVSSQLVKDVESALRSANISQLSVTSSGNRISVFYRKGFPFLFILSATLIGMIVLTILIVGWQLWREIVQTIGKPTMILVVVAVVAISLLIAVKSTKLGGSI